MSVLPRARRVIRWLGIAVLTLLAVYLVARAVVEVVTVNPNRPETYRQDWGGPHYLGVLLVHAGPGLLVVTLTAHRLRRRALRRGERAKAHADHPVR
ncbi:MAG: hypothetical protein ABI808_04595 [Pseudonocardiales bacterium]